MSNGEKKKAYDQAYRKEHYKRVPLDLPKEKYQEVKAAADRTTAGSVNRYIKNAIDEKLERESLE